MVDLWGDVLRPPKCTTPAAVKADTNTKRAMKTFIRKKMGHTTYFWLIKPQVSSGALRPKVLGENG